MPSQIVQISLSSLYDLSQLGPALESVMSIEQLQTETYPSTKIGAMTFNATTNPH